MGLAPGEAAKISEEGLPLACHVESVDEEVEIARATVS